MSEYPAVSVPFSPLIHSFMSIDFCNCNASAKILTHGSISFSCFPVLHFDPRKRMRKRWFVCESFMHFHFNHSTSPISNYVLQAWRTMITTWLVTSLRGRCHAFHTVKVRAIECYAVWNLVLLLLSFGYTSLCSYKSWILLYIWIMLDRSQ
jgi:hypothetical protein